VLVGGGLLDQAPDLMAVWPFDQKRSRAFCVTDESVGALYGNSLGEVEQTIAIPPGERHKTLASAERIWEQLVTAGMTRADHLVALGGGVVGDLAGFLCCHLPARRAGRPGSHDTRRASRLRLRRQDRRRPARGEELHRRLSPARGVLVDPDTLATLPTAELAAGWVEVLKTALIAGGELWERVSAGGEVDERTILACARTKLAVVAADERDGRRRQVLNLGHTVGHAIETATGYARYRHGEAVGLGLLARCASPDRRICARRCASCCSLAGCPSCSRHWRRVEQIVTARRAIRSASARMCRSCSCKRRARS